MCFSMLHQLLLIHLYRPFLKYSKAKTPLPSHVSPRKICTQAASVISKLLRMYKRTYGLKQICNIVVYIAHTACTIHLLNLPEKNAQRDVIHGLRNLEEMADGWLCARRTLRILDISANKWQVELPSEAISILERTHTKWGSWGSWDQATSPSTSNDSPTPFIGIRNSATSPSRFSTENQVPVAPHAEPLGPNAMAMLGAPLGSQYRASPSVPAPIPPERPARRAPGTYLQKPEFTPPEPTYLQPISYTGYPMSALTSSSSTSHPTTTNPGAWYDTSGFTTQTSTPAAQFSESETLVEESQNWWTGNAALGVGLEDWAGGWSPDMSTPVSHLQYENTLTPLVPLGQHPCPMPESPSQDTMGIPNLGPGANQTPRHDDEWK